MHTGAALRVPTERLPALPDRRRLIDRYNRHLIDTNGVRAAYDWERRFEHELTHTHGKNSQRHFPIIWIGRQRLRERASCVESRSPWLDAVSNS